MRVLLRTDGVSAKDAVPLNPFSKGVQGPTLASLPDARWPSGLYHTIGVEADGVLRPSVFGYKSFMPAAIVEWMLRMEF